MIDNKESSTSNNTLETTVERAIKHNWEHIRKVITEIKDRVALHLVQELVDFYATAPEKEKTLISGYMYAMFIDEGSLKDFSYKLHSVKEVKVKVEGKEELEPALWAESQMNGAYNYETEEGMLEIDVIEPLFNILIEEMKQREIRTRESGDNGMFMVIDQYKSQERHHIDTYRITIPLM